MGLYGDQVLPRIINVACGMKVTEPLRRRGSGDEIEIGFGSGLNVPFYPERIAQVSAVEPADLAGSSRAGASARQASPFNGPA
jgi:hypothetical protein